MELPTEDVPDVQMYRPRHPPCFNLRLLYLCYIPISVKRAQQIASAASYCAQPRDRDETVVNQRLSYLQRLPLIVSVHHRLAAEFHHDPHCLLADRNPKPSSATTDAAPAAMQAARRPAHERDEIHLLAAAKGEAPPLRDGRSLPAVW